MMTLDLKHRALLDEAQRRGQPDTAAMRLCFEVLSLAAAIDRACADRLAPHGLSEGKFVVLMLLRDLAEGLSPHELAERAGVTRATITGLLDGLERQDLLARRRDRDDRRKLTVRLTPTGQALAARLFDEHTAWIASLFAGFTGEDRAALSRLLESGRRMIDASAYPSP